MFGEEHDVKHASVADKVQKASKQRPELHARVAVLVHLRWVTSAHGFHPPLLAMQQVYSFAGLLVRRQICLSRSRQANTASCCQGAQQSQNKQSIPQLQMLVLRIPSTDFPMCHVERPSLGVCALLFEPCPPPLVGLMGNQKKTRNPFLGLPSSKTEPFFFFAPGWGSCILMQAGSPQPGAEELEPSRPKVDAWVIVCRKVRCWIEFRAEDSLSEWSKTSALVVCHYNCPNPKSAKSINSGIEKVAARFAFMCPAKPQCVSSFLRRPQKTSHPNCSKPPPTWPMASPLRRVSSPPPS